MRQFGISLIHFWWCGLRSVSQLDGPVCMHPSRRLSLILLALFRDRDPEDWSPSLCWFVMSRQTHPVQWLIRHIVHCKMIHFRAPASLAINALPHYACLPWNARSNLLYPDYYPSYSIKVRLLGAAGTTFGYWRAKLCQSLIKGIFAWGTQEGRTPIPSAHIGLMKCLHSEYCMLLNYP